MAKTIKVKRTGAGLEIKSFPGKKGETYIVFRLPDGAFHVFVETEAKQAARNCGSTKSDTNTREYWKQIWDSK